MRSIPFHTMTLALLLATLHCQNDDSGSAPQSPSNDDDTTLLPDDDDDDTTGDDSADDDDSTSNDDDDAGTTDEELPQLEIVCTGREGEPPTGEDPVDLQCVLDHMPEVAADPACNDPLASPCSRHLECVSEVAPENIEDWLFQYDLTLTRGALYRRACFCDPQNSEEQCTYFNQAIAMLRSLSGCPFDPSPCDKEVYKAFRAQIWCEHRSMVACLEQAVGPSYRRTEVPTCEELAEDLPDLSNGDNALLNSYACLGRLHRLEYSYYGWSTELMDAMDAYIAEHDLRWCAYMGRNVEECIGQ